MPTARTAADGRNPGRATVGGTSPENSRVGSRAFIGDARRVLVLVLLVSVTAFTSKSRAADVPDFQRDVRPLLSDRCLACHGPDEHERQADLRLDQPASLTADRDGLRVVVPGDPDASELIIRVTSDDESLVMPPPESGKTLSDEEIGILRRWIASGAEMTTHWAYVPPERHPAPTPKRSNWSSNWIDDFILHRLETEGLHPSPDADTVTLIRRLYFDLTGLPPSPQDLETWTARFESGSRDDTVEELVDDLLSTDACAERLAMYWLDLVRYADTVGYHGDQDHNISPYRDWVIDAFATNMPFDQFTREQLAGDLLPGSDIDQKIATGYNRLLQTSHEGGVQPKEYLAIYAADRVRNVSAVWMGATLGCAQCHDHKYDPYTSKDFYSLAAFFADVDEAQHFKIGSNSLPTARPPEIKVHTRRERARLSKLEQQLAEADRLLEMRPDDSELIDQRKQLGFAIEDLNAAKRTTMVTVSIEPREMRILPRGNWLDDSGEIVRPAVPAFLASFRQESGSAESGSSATGSQSRETDRLTRLDLANWLTDPENGTGLLTARLRQPLLVPAVRPWHFSVTR
ncbi:MAG: DUF1549 domain-containing protein [Planctomycetaceae bacterium]